jgi:hypothetical protein
MAHVGQEAALGGVGLLGGVLGLLQGLGGQVLGGRVLDDGQQSVLRPLWREQLAGDARPEHLAVTALELLLGTEQPPGQHLGVQRVAQLLVGLVVQEPVARGGARQLTRAVAEDLLHVGVAADHAAVAGERNAHGGAVEDGGELARGLGQPGGALGYLGLQVGVQGLEGLVGMAPLGDVAQDDREEGFAIHMQLGDGRLGGEDLAVQTPGHHGLAAHAAAGDVAGAEGADLVGVRGAVGLGQQDVDGLTEQLGLAGAEHRERGAVDAAHALVGVDDDDGVHRRVDHGFQPCLAVLHLAAAVAQALGHGVEGPGQARDLARRMARLRQLAVAVLAGRQARTGVLHLGQRARHQRAQQHAQQAHQQQGLAQARQQAQPGLVGDGGVLAVEADVEEDDVAVGVAQQGLLGFGRTGQPDPHAPLVGRDLDVGQADAGGGGEAARVEVGHDLARRPAAPGEAVSRQHLAVRADEGQPRDAAVRRGDGEILADVAGALPPAALHTACQLLGQQHGVLTAFVQRSLAAAGQRVQVRGHQQRGHGQQQPQGQAGAQGVAQRPHAAGRKRVSIRSANGAARRSRRCSTMKACRRSAPCCTTPPGFSSAWLRATFGSSSPSNTLATSAGVTCRRGAIIGAVTAGARW